MSVVELCLLCEVSCVCFVSRCVLGWNWVSQ